MARPNRNSYKLRGHAAHRLPAVPWVCSSSNAVAKSDDFPVEHTHRLRHFARSEGIQDEMKERLLRAYFTDGIRISDLAALASAAGDVGLDGEEVRELLASDRYAEDVRRDQARAMELGIRGVPFFLFDGQHGVSGAQPPEVLAEVLAHVFQERREREHPPQASAGSRCDDEGCEPVPDASDPEL